MAENGEKHDGLRKKTAGNILWRFFERCGAMGVNFVVSIILAQIISPDDYGVVAIVVAIDAVLGVFVDSGLSNALIQKKDADSLDFSSVFYFNLACGVVLYALLFLAAPLIAQFYAMPELCAIIRVMGITVLIAAIKNVQQAFVSRNFLFRRFFFSALGGTLGSAVVGIVMAYTGFGVWALVWQILFNAAVDTLILTLTIEWKPTREFSLSRLKGLFSFGWKLLASSLIDTVYNNLRQFIIGKLYDSSALAFYNRGKQLPNMLIVNINSAIDSVLLPVLSNVQDDRARIKAITRRSMRVSSFVMWPLMLGMAAVAEPFIELILPDAWLPSVPFLRIFCVAFAFYPVHTANANSVKALGRTDIYLRLEIVKKTAGFALLIATMWLGTTAMAYSFLAAEIVSVMLNAPVNKRLLSYGYLEQLRDLFPPILLSAAMGAAVYAVTLLGLPCWAELLIQLPLGVILYAGAAKLLRFDSFDYVLGTLKSLLKR